MATVSVHEAKTHFSGLIARCGGRADPHRRGGGPQAMLVPFEGRGVKRVPGMNKGKVIIHPNFGDPMPEFDPDYMHPDDPMRELVK